MFCMAGHQMLAVRSGGTRSRETALGYYMVAASIGQGARPVRRGLARRLGRAAADRQAVRDRPRRRGGRACSSRCWCDRPASPPVPRRRGDFIPIGRLFKLRGFPAVMLSQRGDGHLPRPPGHLPAGAGRGPAIDSHHIGLLLTVRSVASLVSRVFYARLIFAVGRAPLTLVEHARQRRGLLGAGHSAAAAGDVCGSCHARLRHGHRLDADHLGRGSSRAGRGLRHRAHAADDRQPRRPDRVSRARRRCSPPPPGWREFWLALGFGLAASGSPSR